MRFCDFGFFFFFFGCLDDALSGILVLRLCLFSTPTLLVVLEMKAATMAPLLLVICPTRCFSKQVALCTKIYQQNVINLPRGEHPLPDFVSSPRFGTCYRWQALKHTPQGTGRAVLSSGEEGTGSRGMQVCAGIMLLLGNSLITAHQKSGRYL